MEHTTTLDEKAKEEIRSYLENDAERSYLIKLHLNKFEFVLKVYEERIRDLKLKDDIVTKLNEAVAQTLENNSVEITPADERKFIGLLLKRLCIRENGDTLQDFTISILTNISTINL